MSGREFQEWLAYNTLSPIGAWRGDWRAGMLAATVANIWRGADTPPYQPSDFLPRFDGRAQDDPVDEEASILLTQAVFQSLTEQLGGAVKG